MGFRAKTLRVQFVLGEVSLAIIRQLPAQELWCAGEVVVQLNGDAAGRMTVPSSVDET